MKKRIFLLLSLVMMLSLCACGGTMSKDEMKKDVEETCNAFIDDYDYSDTERYTVDNISYTINELKPQGDMQYLVDIVWNVEIASSRRDESEWNKDWMDILGNVLSSETFSNPKNGREVFVTHTKKDPDDSVKVVINAGKEYSGADYYADVIGPKADGVTCKFCGRVFEKDSENADSIARTGMCSNCANNYKSTSGALKEQPIG